MSTQSFLAFIATAIALAFVPGPDNLFVMTQSAIRGKRIGFLVVLGLCTGLLVHTAAVGLGVAVLFKESQLAFSILKYLGAAYLVYLAWQAFRSKETNIPHDEEVSGSNKQYYFRGILMNITNPKVSIFFLAFLPQFADEKSEHFTLQMIGLGIIFIICTMIAFGLIAILSARIGEVFSKSTKIQRQMNVFSGFIFLGLAAKLMLTNKN